MIYFLKDTFERKIQLHKIGFNICKHKTFKLFIATKETKQMNEVTHFQLKQVVIGDKYFGREDREVLLSSLSGYELALQNGIIEYGTLGIGSLSMNRLDGSTVGRNSVTEGYNCTARSFFPCRRGIYKSKLN